MIAKAQAMAALIVRRVLVHAVSAMTAIGLASSGAGSSAFAAYIGLVCLVPGGFSNRPQWLGSVAAGMVGFLLSLASGLSLSLALFWGGLVTWLVRLALKKGRIGLAWVSSLFLVPMLVNNLVNAGAPDWRALIAMAVTALAVIWLEMRVIAPRLDQSFLSEFTARLGSLRASASLPDALSSPVRELESLSRSYLSLPAASLSVALLDPLRELNAAMSREGRFTRDMDKKAVRRLEAGLLENRDRLAAELDRIRPEQPTVTFAQGMNDSGLEAFRDAAASLLRKKNRLPAGMQAQVDSLHASTEKILECMRSDPADLAPGTRFLSRYLPAAHNLVDEYLRLTGEAGGYAGAEDLARRSAQTLERLAQAFAAEHGRLLQNDFISLTAELNTLDKLLKMDGR